MSGPAQARRIDELVDMRAHDSSVAVSFPGVEMTYEELASTVREHAAALVTNGIGYGDHVALVTHDGMELVAASLASALVGAVSVPLNPRFKPRELRYVIANSDAKLLLADQSCRELVEEALPGLSESRPQLIRLSEAPLLRHAALVDAAEVSGGWSAWAEALAAGQRVGSDRIASETAKIRKSDAALMIYTSGTTARPRGCLHSHGSLLNVGRGMVERLGLTSDDRFWTPLPFFHMGGFDVLFGCLMSGGTMVHPGAFEPGLALKQLADLRCSVAFPAFETIWLQVLEHPEFADTDLSSLRIVINVGAPERMMWMQEQLPRSIQISATGSTEGCGFTCIGSTEDGPEERAVYGGRPIRGMEVRVVDPQTRQPVAPGEPGEFAFRGESRFLEYYRDAESNSRRIDGEGWYYSGDLVKSDAAGRIRFMARLGDMIKVGGENVSPAEVEGYLQTHPSVRLAQVVGAPDGALGEVVAAFVELKAEGDITAEEMIEFCLGEISTYKVPRYVEFVTEWPMSGTKIQKFKLREQIADQLARDGITAAPKISSSGSVPAASVNR